MKVDPKAKVLVVDDMGTMRKIVIRALREMGWTQFVEAQDGEKAWEILQTNKFQIVFSDWNMPKVSGIELLKKVRADARFDNLPFLMITAESERSQVVEAIANGASGYIVKPFTAVLIKEKIESINLVPKVNKAS